MAETQPVTQADTTTDDNTSSWWTFTRVTVISVASIGILYLLIFGLGIGFAIWQGDSAYSWINYFRDLLTIGLSLMSFIVVVGVGVLIIQIARFVNLLRSEVKPITNDTKEALKNVRTTSEFVKNHGVEPIIKTQSFMAGLIAFLREIVRITRILQRPRNRGGDSNE